VIKGKDRFTSEPPLGTVRGRVVLHSDEVSGKDSSGLKEVILSYEFPEREQLKHCESQ